MQSKFQYIKIIILGLIFLSGCSGPNPNPGERTIDMAIESRSLTEDNLQNLRKKAENGLPWAQLRMGVIHEKGNGVAKDINEAEKWYLLTSQHYGDNDWSRGHIVGAIGKSGYFNQNSDALVAKYQLAGIYLNKDYDKLNVEKGYELIKEVKKSSNNRHIFYCCEFSGGRYITVDMVDDLIKKAESMKQ